MSATLRVEDFTANQRLFKQPPPVVKVSLSYMEQRTATIKWCNQYIAVYTEHSLFLDMVSGVREIIA